MTTRAKQQFTITVPTSAGETDELAPEVGSRNVISIQADEENTGFVLVSVDGQDPSTTHWAYKLAAGKGILLTGSEAPADAVRAIGTTVGNVAGGWWG